MGLFPLRVVHKKIWLTLAVIGVILLAWRIWSVRGASQHDRAGFDRAVPVATATALRGELKLLLSALGTVTATNAVVVKSRVDGQLLRVHFKEGQFVKAGALLAEIDPRPFAVQLAQAEGQLARDTALLKNAQLDLERYQMLWSQDSIAKQQVDAQAALVSQYEGAIKVDAGQIAAAKLQLTYAQVTAPASGRVGLRQVDPGNIVHTADSNGIVSIAQVQPIYVIFTLPEDNLPRLVQRMNKQTRNTQDHIAIDAYDRTQKLKLATGSLVAIDNQIDTATGTIKLKAEFKNDDSALFPNQFVNVRLQIDTLRDVTLVPVDAVQHGAQGDFVYAVQADNTVKLQSVRIGESDGEHVVIESGIEPGSTVVIEGLEQLRDGSAVSVVQRESQ
jgi:membrane fusion protein, multidrug efflux system